MSQDRPPAWLARFSSTRLGRALRGLDDKAMRDQGAFERRVKAATFVGLLALVAAKVVGGLRDGQGVVIAVFGAMLSGVLFFYVLRWKSNGG